MSIEPVSFDFIQDDLDDPLLLAKWRKRFELSKESKAYQDVFTMSNPLVTVCIATSDRSEILAERALPSVLKQTYQNLEVIVVGDCCADDTAERVAALHDSRFKFVNLPERGPYPRPGLHRWMVAGTNPGNYALRHSTGRLITHIDEDDTNEPDRISVLVHELQRYKVDFVYHPFHWEEIDKSWSKLGNGSFAHGETGTGMVLYNSWLNQIPFDVMAFKMNEPGDWNRFRKFVAIGASSRYVPLCLTRHWRYPVRGDFVAKDHESFLD